jgi:hypothetical protein
MAECECLPKCPFFNDMMPGLPSTTEMLKKRYCRGDNALCARYMVFKKLGRDKVPHDLFPNQPEKARAILAG